MNKYKFSEIRVGLCESFKVKITQNMVDHFVNISGDDNPLHIDNAYAMKKGFKGKKADAYIYGTMRKTGWKPKKEKT